MYSLDACMEVTLPFTDTSALLFMLSMIVILPLR
jgi:hypothetical protein